MTLNLLKNSSASGPISAPNDAVAEANHRIANNLALVASLVRMQARDLQTNAPGVGNQGVQLLLEEIGGRIETIGRLHRLLVQGCSGFVDLTAYLNEISEAVVSSLAFAGKARLAHVSDRATMVPAECALPVGLIVGELVTNAVKYAHPTGVSGRIAVGYRVLPSVIVVEVSDDGVGLPEGFDAATDGGLGLQLVRSLAVQLGATLDFIDREAGLTVTLSVPR